MQKEWSSSKRDAETLKEYPHVGKGGNVRENSASKLTNDVKNYSGNDHTVKSNFVVENNTETHLCDNVIIHSQRMDERDMPGSVVYDRKAREIRVCCRDGWVAFRHVLLKGRKLMTAQDFYNGFMSKVSRDLHKFT